ncbi:isopeptide-forming domain-containing fimbrial protein [Corynebacterium sp. CCUG 18816]|uniref:LPXTG cell wall anchor domain-containing protein n=1 Tax=Corynebacterium pseudogenitalium TaxID=38303 RepID=UPI00210DDD45|nr:LPXTG cell wall anchor domain-containing protein [Corynebacterium pseudogenitalium]MCQ4616663.1 isopeptide-forming domain-containing fimbrial protein [Corynebacterium pseudogenitalium]
MRNPGTAMAVALAVTVGVAGVGMPAFGPPAAVAAAPGSVTVDLRAAAGVDGLGTIGERTVTASRITTVDMSTQAGRESLATLDVPALLRTQPDTIVEVATARTSDGRVTLDGLQPGAYLFTLGDSEAKAASQVFFAPFVVPVTEGSARTVEPKAQHLNVALTASRQRVRPGEDVTFTVRGVAPNPSDDGTIGHYELILTLAGNLEFSGEPTVRINGVALGPGDVTFHREGNRLRAVLTKSGLAKLARARATDASTTVTLEQHARATAAGTAGADATLTTNGMDPERNHVTVEATHADVLIEAPAQQGSSKGDRRWLWGLLGLLPLIPLLPGLPEQAGSSGPAGPSPAGPQGTSPKTPTPTTEGQPSQDGPRGRVDQVLAYTGANVIWLALLALALIVAGWLLARRKEDENEQ